MLLTEIVEGTANCIAC